MSDLSSADRKLMIDFAAWMPCYRQHREGWYVKSCYEEGLSARRCCSPCRILRRLEKRLSA